MISPNPHPTFPVEKWAAIAGRWRFEPSNVNFLGAESDAQLGLAIAAGRLRDGIVCTTVKLSQNHDTTAGVVLGYQSQNAAYVAGCLGAFNRAYVVMAYSPGSGWSSISGAGSIENLNADATYQLKVELSGQRIRMTVDDVDVLDVVLPRPLEGNGFGLHAWGRALVEFHDTSIRSAEPKVFVIMPFSEPFDTLYREVINPVASGLGFTVTRVDEMDGPGIILKDIQTQIQDAHAVIAEITTKNPNVFYELGYAHALNKPAVLLVRRQEGPQMPFDIRGYRAIFYDDSIGGKKLVESTLQQHLAAVLRDQA